VAESIATTRKDPLMARNEDMIIAVYIGRPSMNVVREYLVYDSNDLMAEMGGLLGMLFGFSFLSAFDDFSFLIKKSLSKMFEREK